MQNVLKIGLGLMILICGVLSEAQTRRFGGSGKPPVYEGDTEPMAKQLPAPRPTTALNLDVLWKKLLDDQAYQRASGHMSIQERAYFKNADPSSLEFVNRKNEALNRFLEAYKSDLTTGKTTPAVELMEKMRSEGMDIRAQAVTSAQAKLKIQESGGSVAARMRAKLRGGARGVKLFGIGDALMLGADTWKSWKESERDESISKRECPEKPDDQYVQMVLLQDEQVQREILGRCTEESNRLHAGLRNSIFLKRAASRQHVATPGQTKCFYKEDGTGVVETLSDQGTKQVISFNQKENIENVRILPQDGKYNGSFLEYSPKSHMVRYTAIKPAKNSTPETDFTAKAQVDGESINSFAARVYCTTDGCTSPGETAHLEISQKDSFVSGVTPSKPFGDIQENSEFLVQSAKTLGHFRIGVEQNFTVPMTFRNVCMHLGAQTPKKQPPKQESAEAKPAAPSSPATIK